MGAGGGAMCMCVWGVHVSQTGLNTYRVELSILMASFCICLQFIVLVFGICGYFWVFAIWYLLVSTIWLGFSVTIREYCHEMRLPIGM